MYNTTHFLEKNRDRLHSDAVRVVGASSSPFVVALLPQTASAPSGAGERRRGGRPTRSITASTTLASQFKRQLIDLVDMLNATSPHFVRCLKPNMQKVQDVFDSEIVLSQMRYSGLLELCRIRKLGYPIRCCFDDFYARYRCIDSKARDISTLLSSLLNRGILVNDQWAKGKTKVFVRNAQSTWLDMAREAAFTVLAVAIQALTRRRAALCHFRAMATILDKVKAAIKACQEDALTRALDLCGELPGAGEHVAVCQDAKRLLVRLREERRVEQLLASAIEARDKSALRSAISAADGLDFHNQGCVETLGTARELMSLIEMEDDVIAGLRAAIASTDREQLNTLLTQAADLDGLDENDVVRHARALQARLHDEDCAILGLKEAMEKRSISKLAAYVAKCGELGLDTPVVAEARTLHEQLTTQLGARHALTSACEARSLDGIRSALGKAAALGLRDDTCVEMKTAYALEAKLAEEASALTSLEAATQARDLAALTLALKDVQRLGLEHNRVVKSAENLRASLAEADDCLSTLNAAVDARDIEAVESALAIAGKLGIPAGMTAAARDLVVSAHPKSGTQKRKSRAKARLSLVVGSDSIDEIKAVMAAGEDDGSSSSSADMVAAQDRIEYLREESRLVEELDRATATATTAATLEQAIKACNSRCQNPAMLEAKMRAARLRLESLEAAEMLDRATALALETRDVDALTSAIINAEAKGVDVKTAREAIASLHEGKALLDNIAQAIEGKDLDALSTYCEAASKRGVGGDLVRQARILVDRDVLVTQTIATLGECLSTSTPPAELLETLNEALETAIQLGLSADAKVEEATKLRDRAVDLAARFAEVRAAAATLNVKAQSPSGILARDVEPLESAIAEARASGVDESTLAEALTFKATMVKQLEVQALLEKSLDDRPEDLETIKAALGTAEELELSLKIMERARAHLEEWQLEKNARQQKQSHGQQREKRQQAADPKYKIQNFRGLRSLDSYARGLVMNRKKLKDGMLKWQSTLIPHSLVDLDDRPEANKAALKIHRCLLGYMGDKALVFPATLAQDILKSGLENAELRDEIYLQTIKQLSCNPTPASVAKGWQIMCMCAATFQPSSHLDYYLINFLLTQREKRGAVRNYADYSLSVLESGGSGFVPSIEEIGTYQERPPVLATVLLVDGTVLTEDLPVSPDVNCAKVCEYCAQLLELTDERQSTFGIHVYDESSSALTPRPLQAVDFLGDIVVQKARQRLEFSFVYKRKLAFPHDNYHSTNKNFQRLVCLQAVDEVFHRGTLPLACQDQVVRLAALSMALTDNFPDSAAGIEAMADPAATDFLPPDWRSKLTSAVLAHEVSPYRESLGFASVCSIADDDERAARKGELVDALQRTFIEVLWEHDLYGGHFFHCDKIDYPNQPGIITALPVHVTIAFHASGISIFETASGSRLGALHASFGYADVSRWSGSSSTFSLHIWSPASSSTFELKVSTSQATDMAAIILDFIKAIMAHRDAEQ